MKVIIHNQTILGNEHSQASFEQEVNKKVNKLDDRLKDYTKPVELNIHLKKISEQTYEVKAVLDLSLDKLVVSDKTDNPTATVNNLIDSLAHLLKKRMSKIRKEHLYKRKRHQKRTATLVGSLDGLKPADGSDKPQKNEISELFLKNVPLLKAYIKYYLKKISKKKNIPLDAQDVLDEVLLDIYENYKYKEEDTEFEKWMFFRAKEWMDQYAEQQEDVASAVSADELMQVEVEGLEEDFTVDADGDLMMFDELEDISYLNERLAEESLEIPVEEADLAGLNTESKQAIRDLKSVDRFVFMLYWNHDMDIQEISTLLEAEYSLVKNSLLSAFERMINSIKEQL